jgi:hypothetical protein
VRRRTRRRDARDDAHETRAIRKHAREIPRSIDARRRAIRESDDADDARIG